MAGKREKLDSARDMMLQGCTRSMWYSTQDPVGIPVRAMSRILESQKQTDEWFISTNERSSRDLEALLSSFQ